MIRQDVNLVKHGSKTYNWMSSLSVIDQVFLCPKIPLFIIASVPLGEAILNVPILCRLEFSFATKGGVSGRSVRFTYAFI